MLITGSNIIITRSPVKRAAGALNQPAPNNRRIESVPQNYFPIAVVAEAIFFGSSIGAQRAWSARSIKAALFLQRMLAKYSAFTMR
jgi:hypothetical protein